MHLNVWIFGFCQRWLLQGIKQTFRQELIRQLVNVQTPQTQERSGGEHNLLATLDVISHPDCGYVRAKLVAMRVVIRIVLLFCVLMREGYHWGCCSLSFM